MFACIEIVRGPNNEIKDLVAVDSKTIYKKSKGGYVQVIDNAVVQEFKENEMLVLKVA